MWIPLDSHKETAKFGVQILDWRDRKAHLAPMLRPYASEQTAASQLRGLAGALLMVAASTLVGLAMAPRWGNSAVDLIYLPSVLAAAVFAGTGPALLAALASALAYNFFFTAPHLTFRIDNPNDIVTVIVLFAVAVVASQLASSVRKQARIAESHAARNATIAGLARRLLTCMSEQQIGDVSTAELASIFDCNALLLENGQEPAILSSAPTSMQLTPGDQAAAALALVSGERTGRGLDRAVPSEWQFHPVRSGRAILGVMGIGRDDGAPPVRSDQLPLLDNLLDQVALALERGRLEAETHDFARTRERDQLRSALLSSIGQDLRPPLAAIGSAVRALKRSGSSDKELVSAVGSEASKLDRYLSNLLDLTPESDRQPLEVAGVTIDLFNRRILREGKEVHLTPKEYSVLAELAKQPGRVLAHAHLLRAAWGPAQEGQTEYLRVAIKGLRQKLEHDPSRPALIINEPAVGYRLAT